jgi:hypothetical protein
MPGSWLVDRNGSGRRSLRGGSTKLTVTGDVLDAASVNATVEGCNAPINAATIYSLTGSR